MMNNLLEDYEWALERNLGAFEDACRLKSTTKALLKYQYTTCLEMLLALDRHGKTDPDSLKAGQKNSRAYRILLQVEKNRSSISLELQNFVSLHNTKAWDTSR